MPRRTAATAARLPCLAACLLATACRTTGTPRPTATAGGPSVEALATMMAGSYTSAEQAKKDPDFRDIHLEMVRIWPKRSDGPWLYVEQAAAGSLDKPYRQRVYQLALSEEADRAPGTVESRVFELPGEPLAFAGAWSDPKRLDVIGPGDLHRLEGCTVYLNLQEDGTWLGGTTGVGCANNFRGATYATSEVTIDADSLRSWDRGFDKDGKQIWGAVKGAYVFRRAEAEKKPVK